MLTEAKKRRNEKVIERETIRKENLCRGRREKKEDLGGVWYMHLKTENMCLKTCVEIRVSEKVCGNTCNVV